MYISETTGHARIRFVIGKVNAERFPFLVRLTLMRQLMTFGKLSNDVDTTGGGSMRVAASRVAIS
jgi:hypothetical protein